MFTLAGNTASSVATSHQPAQRAVRGDRTPAPPTISAAPLANTSARAAGSASGTIAL